MLPGSTSRNPTRPLMGAVMRLVDQLQLGIVDLTLIGLDDAFRLAYQSLLRVDLLFGHIALLV